MPREERKPPGPKRYYFVSYYYALAGGDWAIEDATLEIKSDGFHLEAVREYIKSKHKALHSTVLFFRRITRGEYELAQKYDGEEADLEN